MALSDEIAAARAAIERLEQALLDCSDSRIRQVIEDWLVDARKKLNALCQT
jgi:hypothetical protein